VSDTFPSSFYTLIQLILKIILSIQFINKEMEAQVTTPRSLFLEEVEWGFEFSEFDSRAHDLSETPYCLGYSEWCFKMRSHYLFSYEFCLPFPTVFRQEITLMKTQLPLP
jgi:hypothetical protein